MVGDFCGTGGSSERPQGRQIAARGEKKYDPPEGEQSVADQQADGEREKSEHDCGKHPADAIGPCRYPPLQVDHDGTAVSKSSEKRDTTPRNFAGNDPPENMEKFMEENPEDQQCERSPPRAKRKYGAAYDRRAPDGAIEDRGVEGEKRKDDGGDDELASTRRRISHGRHSQAAVAAVF